MSRDGLFTKQAFVVADLSLPIQRMAPLPRLPTLDQHLPVIGAVARFEKLDMPKIILTSKPLCLEVGVEALQVSQRRATTRPPVLVNLLLGLGVEELVDDRCLRHVTLLFGLPDRNDIATCQHARVEEVANMLVDNTVWCCGQTMQ